MKGKTDYLRLKWETFASKQSTHALIILGFMVPVVLHISIIFSANGGQCFYISKAIVL